MRHAVVHALTIAKRVLDRLIGVASPNRREPPPTLAELEAAGLIEDIPFHATRAFQVEEYDDEGSHYFIEVDGGNVLYLSGQYLYDYDPIPDGDPDACPRQFPCTDFVIKRHKVEREIYAIECRGSVLEPEVLAPYATLERLDEWPDDGVIITGVTDDAIKAKGFEHSSPPLAVMSTCGLQSTRVERRPSIIKRMLPAARLAGYHLRHRRHPRGDVRRIRARDDDRSLSGCDSPSPQPQPR